MRDILHCPVLVLNKSWMPVRVQTLKRALTKVTNDRAKFLDSETFILYSWEDWLSNFRTDIDTPVNYPVIRSKYFCFKRPEIIVCTNYNKIPHNSLKLSRKNILIRDKYQCQYTGQRLSRKNATLDHVVPKSKGGKTAWNNIVACSFEANTKKANQTPQQAGMMLLRTPKKPQWSPIYTITLKSRPKSWEKFIKSEDMEEIKNWDMEESDTP